VRSYRGGIRLLLVAWAWQDLLRPDPDAATMYLRQLERRGLAPSTIQARIAAARGLYAGLRWCRAVGCDPFVACHAPRDATPAWEKRMPYADDEAAALLHATTDPADRVLVRRGKGGKQRVVALSASLRQALQALARREDGGVLAYRTAGSAWRHMQLLCASAGVTAKGCMRCGTRRGRASMRRRTTWRPPRGTWGTASWRPRASTPSGATGSCVRPSAAGRVRRAPQQVHSHTLGRWGCRLPLGAASPAAVGR